MKLRFWPLLLAALLAGCAGEKGIVDRGDYKVDTRRAAQAAYPRIKVLVIHYTADDFDTSLATLTDRHVSSHYLIPANPPEKGGKPVIWQLVPERELAWHAGASFWRGATRLNDTSVGIELENYGYRKIDGQKRFFPFSPPQIAVLSKLARDIIDRYQIAPQNVVAHADIAPQRKDDPGPLFPWQALLSKRGVAAPIVGTSREEQLDELLSAVDLSLTPQMSEAQRKRVIQAFQMHFRPARYDGLPDAQSQAIAEALLEKYGQG